MASFTNLKNNYFNGSKEQLFELLGGGWPDLINNDTYDNTCAIRMSRAWLESGYEIPSKFASMDGNHKDGNGRSILIRVPTYEMLLQDKFGRISWGMSKVPGDEFDLSVIPNKTGIILYRADFDDGAYGHVDLWDRYQHIGQFEQLNVNISYAISLWEVR